MPEEHQARAHDVKLAPVVGRFELHRLIDSLELDAKHADELRSEVHRLGLEQQLHDQKLDAEAITKSPAFALLLLTRLFDLTLGDSKLLELTTKNEEQHYPTWLRWAEIILKAPMNMAVAELNKRFKTWRNFQQ